ncbi:MAG TPA: GNAT family N-acetyltransferase [Pseudomonas sp.]|jgi:GNAT superfamily N-acetyltransferase|uniref:GNAT family N-acetyltransferase n=1 Tax=Pseudomonas sp. TaxID=306 RepID=UPI002ED987B0
MSTTLPHVAVRLRPMTGADLIAAHALSQKLKWPHRLEDWQFMHSVSKGFVAEDEQGIFATAFCCLQGDFSTIGLVIVADERQGQGIGRKMMNLALEASAGITATLAATAAGTPLYVSQGFVAYNQLHQYQGTVPAGVVTSELEPGVTLRLLDSHDHAALLALASAATGMDRQPVMSGILSIGEVICGVEQDGELIGFAVLRPFGRGSCVGPVIAETSRQARAMISSLLQGAAGCFVRIDVTQNSGLGGWLETFGFTDVGAAVQMSRGPAPKGSSASEQFAVVTQALG